MHRFDDTTWLSLTFGASGHVYPSSPVILVRMIYTSQWRIYYPLCYDWTVSCGDSNSRLRTPMQPKQPRHALALSSAALPKCHWLPNRRRSLALPPCRIDILSPTPFPHPESRKVLGPRRRSLPAHDAQPCLDGVADAQLFRQGLWEAGAHHSLVLRKVGKEAHHEQRHVCPRTVYRWYCVGVLSHMTIPTRTFGTLSALP